MRSTSKLKDFVYDEAEEYPSFDLDDVREISDDSDGITLRVLVEDAPDESDQVGFQVTRPNMAKGRGRQMFNDRVLNGLRELRDRYRDDRGDNSRDIDASSDPEDASDRQETDRDDTIDDGRDVDGVTNSSAISDADVGPLSVTLGIDEDARDELVEEFNAVLEELEETSASTDAVDDIEERLDDIDDRLTQLEDALSVVGE